MKNSNLHQMINLRAMMIEAQTIGDVRKYGKDSKTCQSKYFNANIGLMVYSILKPLIKTN
tara:strand:- start:539 stop:718 length:180 start_codon:yes stop_codon:yes gene_type:complete